MNSLVASQVLAWTISRSFPGVGQGQHLGSKRFVGWVSREEPWATQHSGASGLEKDEPTL